MSVPCTVRLPIFEGPLDLLLHLIKKNEVAITDIPIAAITDQYLALLEELPELNLDGAGEYLVMAASLMYIKSRMLLPQSDEDGEPDEDPRAELVQQLVEYQRYREVAVALGERHILHRDVFTGPGEPLGEIPSEEEGLPVREASLGDLLDALRTVLQRVQPQRAHEVPRESVSIRVCVERILAHFALGDTVEFAALFATDAHRADVIVTFLALLELIRLRVVCARQEVRFGPINLELAVQSLDEATFRIRDLTDDAWRGGEVSDGHGSAGDE
jgi:segregation and condensation protein A